MKALSVLTSGLAITLSTPLFASCQTAELEPAASANEVEEDVIVQRENGVELTLNTDHWDDKPIVLRYAAPVYVVLENKSGQPINLSLADFRIHEADGDISVARNPEMLGRHIEEDEEIIDEQPDPGNRDRDVVNPFARVDMTETTDPGGVTPPALTTDREIPTRPDQSYTRHWPDHLTKKGLSTGVVETGETASGYVYFDLVPRDSDDLTLTITLDSDDDDSTVAEFNIPLSS